MGLLATIKSLFGINGSKDRHLKCEDCGKQFVFDEGEQRFFKEKGFTDPKRCPRCRKRLKGRSHHRKGRNHKSHHRRGGHYRHRSSIIDGDSPYADE